MVPMLSTCLVLVASSAAHCNTQPGRQQRHESTFMREVDAHSDSSAQRVNAVHQSGHSELRKNLGSISNAAFTGACRPRHAGTRAFPQVRRLCFTWAGGSESISVKSRWQRRRAVHVGVARLAWCPPTALPPDAPAAAWAELKRQVRGGRDARIHAQAPLAAAATGRGMRRDALEHRRPPRVGRWHGVIRGGDRKTAWERIKSASRATDLSLANLHSLSDDILGHVSTMLHLAKVSLEDSSGFSAEGIKHLYRLPWLRMLDLRGTDVSDSALEGIGSLDGLELLWLSGCECVTDAGMVHVGKLTWLKDLGIDFTAVTDDGVKQLTALTQLRILYPPEGGILFDDDTCRRIGRSSGWWRVNYDCRRD
ncbi:unnamed protein product [Closterium sp. Yama58-4]|nr:unnamed protein product [Closterium sp. Yama58-4]